jgi:hypothetical protein
MRFTYGESINLPGRAVLDMVRALPETGVPMKRLYTPACEDILGFLASKGYCDVEAVTRDCLGDR